MAACHDDRKEHLLRYYNRQNVTVLDLTPSLERLFTFLDELAPKKFVGTESRFRTLLFQLRRFYILYPETECPAA